MATAPNSRAVLGSNVSLGGKRVLETSWMNCASHQTRRHLLLSEDQMAHFMGDQPTEDDSRIYSMLPCKLRHSIVKDVSTNAWLDDSPQGVEWAKCIAFKRRRRRDNDCRPSDACRWWLMLVKFEHDRDE